MNSCSLKREIQIDNIKLFACIFVVLGHFFQSMVKADIMPESVSYLWFNKTIGLFHVQLFFICSGYLYQKTTKGINFKSHANNIVKKAIALLIPYFTFSILTWVLKNIFSSSVNDQTAGIINSLFLRPLSPYWYLYCLFLLFVITPIIKNKKGAEILISIGLIFKIISGLISIDIYALSCIFSNLIWFAMGMALQYFDINSLAKKFKLIGGLLCIALFGILNAVYFKHNIKFPCYDFIMSIFACLGFMLLFCYIFERNKQPRVLEFLSKYTMPIFLLHTIFAATLRAILIKVGITNAAMHIALGILISFAGPIIVAMIGEKIKFIDFFFYPVKYVKKQAKNYDQRINCK